MSSDYQEYVVKKPFKCGQDVYAPEADLAAVQEHYPNAVSVYKTANCNQAEALIKTGCICALEPEVPTQLVAKEIPNSCCDKGASKEDIDAQIEEALEDYTPGPHTVDTDTFGTVDPDSDPDMVLLEDAAGNKAEFCKRQFKGVRWNEADGQYEAFDQNGDAYDIPIKITRAVVNPDGNTLTVTDAITGLSCTVPKLEQDQVLAGYEVVPDTTDDGVAQWQWNWLINDIDGNLAQTIPGPIVEVPEFVNKAGQKLTGPITPLLASDFIAGSYTAGDLHLVIAADGSCKLQVPNHNYTWTSTVDADGNVTYPADHSNPALAGTTVPAVDGVGSLLPAGTVVTSHTDFNGSYASSDCPVITDADFSDEASDLDDPDCHTKVIKRGNDLYAEAPYRCYAGRISIVKNGDFISRTTPIPAGSTGASFVLEAEDILSIPNPDPCRCVMFQGTTEMSNMAWVSTAHPANLRARTRIFKDGVSYSNQLTGYSHTIENDTAGIPDQVTLATSATSNKMGACKVAVGETTELQFLVEVQSRVNGNNLNGLLSQNNESMQWRICYTQQACAE